MPVWLSAACGVTLLIAAILCRKSEHLRGYSAPAFLSAAFFLGYTLLVAFMIYR